MELAEFWGVLGAVFMLAGGLAGVGFYTGAGWEAVKGGYYIIYIKILWVRLFGFGVIRGEVNQLRIICWRISGRGDSLMVAANQLVGESLG